MIVPWAKWRPVPSHSGPMTQHYGLVVHVQVGSGSCWPEFYQPANGASSTWWIAKDGTLEQYVDTNDTAWTEMAGNQFYNSVETEGEPSEPFTAAQAAALARLMAWGHAAYFWPLQLVDHGARGITTHAHYPSGAADPAWGGHLCPGPVRSAQLPAIVEAAAHELVVVAPPAAPAAHLEEIPDMYFVHTAGGWYQVFASGMVVPLDPGTGTSLTHGNVLGPIVEGEVSDAYIQNLLKAWASRSAVTAG